MWNTFCGQLRLQFGSAYICLKSMDSRSDRGSESSHCVFGVLGLETSVCDSLWHRPTVSILTGANKSSYEWSATESRKPSESNPRSGKVTAGIGGLSASIAITGLLKTGGAPVFCKNLNRASMLVQLSFSAVPRRDPRKVVRDICSMSAC